MVICVRSRVNPIGILLSFYYAICHAFVMYAWVQLALGNHQKSHVPSWEMVKLNVLAKFAMCEGNCKLQCSKMYVTKLFFQHYND